MPVKCQVTKVAHRQLQLPASMQKQESLHLLARAAALKEKHKLEEQENALTKDKGLGKRSQEEKGTT